jgi:hypothetical protein
MQLRYSQETKKRIKFKKGLTGNQKSSQQLTSKFLQG